VPGRSVGVVAAFLLAACATWFPASRDWVELKTIHFDIVSSLSANETLALARDLELFRASVEFLAGVPLPAPARVRVYAFDDRGLDRPFNRRNVPAPSFESGYVLESLAGAAIVLRSGGGWRRDASIALRHDYAHYLLRNRGGLDRPAWYDEGMAWLAATIEVDSPRAVLGQLPDSQMRILRRSTWLPIGEVLDADSLGGWSASRREAFGAEAWALVHDLHFYGARPEEVGGRLSEILTGGIAEWTAFRRSLDAGLEARNRRLALFKRRERWEGIEIEGGPGGKPAAARPIDRAEARAHLGWLALELDRRTVAARHFRSVLRDRPGDARALAGLAAVAARRGRWADARSQLQQAGALDDPRSCVAAARLHLEQARGANDAEERAQGAGRARVRLEACAELGAVASEVQALCGEAYLLEGQAAAARAPLERAHELLPSSLRIQLLRARQRRLEGAEGAARLLALAVLSRSHDDALREAARGLIEDAGSASQSRDSPPIQLNRMPTPARGAFCSRWME
jgi:tetratricopeptide (TPR) repeat protein